MRVFKTYTTSGTRHLANDLKTILRFTADSKEICRNCLSSLCWYSWHSTSTQKDMLSYLGLINYCRQWIPVCSWQDLKGTMWKDTLCKATRTPDIMSLFRHLKAAICSAPALGLPQYMLWFHVYISESSSTAFGVLTWEQCGNYRPITYLCKTFD